MSKNKGKAQAFGSRNKVDQRAVVRSGSLRLKANREDMLAELRGMLNNATAMPTSATVAMSYNREYSHLFTAETRPAYNTSLRSLVNVVKNHKDACGKIKETLDNYEKQYAATPIRTQADVTNSQIEMLNVAGTIQDVMNDFATIGYYAIDAVLQHYRDLAASGAELPSPAYMNPSLGQEAFNKDDINAEPEMLILDLPKETGEPSESVTIEGEATVVEAAVQEESSNG